MKSLILWALLFGIVIAFWAPRVFAQSTPDEVDPEVSRITTGIETSANAAEKALEALGRGDVAGVVDAVHELPSGANIKVRLGPKADASDRVIAATLGSAELSAAVLLRNNLRAGQALSEVGATVGSKATAPPPKLVLPSSMPATPPAASRGLKFLRRVPKIGRFAAILSNVATMGGSVNRASMGRLGRRMGGFGRLSTRQVLYAHGTYNTMVATTGQTLDVDFVFTGEDLPAAPAGGPELADQPAAEPPTASVAPTEAVPAAVPDVAPSVVVPSVVVPSVVLPSVPVPEPDNTVLDAAENLEGLGASLDALKKMINCTQTGTCPTPGGGKP